MNFEEYSKLVKGITFGKKIGDVVYIHKDGLGKIPIELSQLVVRVEKALKISPHRFNLIKFSKSDFRFSLLSYPKFESYPYPPLHESWTVDLKALGVRKAQYADAKNPPILHRRETFLPDDHRLVETFKEFTAQGESRGLYEDSKRIGSLLGWQRTLRNKGYKLDHEGNLITLELNPAEIQAGSEPANIERHKTALSRDRLSLPLFLLSKHGYLDGKFTVLDYGCGRGDDLRELEAHEIDCVGWDPNFSPDTELENRDLVNLGYVINVIEDRDERDQALRKAWGFTDKLLLVSAMLGNESVFEKYQPYKDGVLTKRQTFQKYYFQNELKTYIESTLNEEALALAPGIFLVFRDKSEQQTYLRNKQRRPTLWQQRTSRPLTQSVEEKAKLIYAKNKEILEEYWESCLDYGRPISPEEFETSEAIKEACGSLQKAFHYCTEIFDSDVFNRNRAMRKDDLLVYLALSFFNKRREIFSRMPNSLQLDIKYFFEQYTKARNQAKDLLYSVADIEILENACRVAHEALPASQLNESHDFIFHKDYLNQCPSEIRVYVGCATQLYGELEDVDLVKVHILSGKITLLVYDDWNKEVPLLKERIKIKLREQDIDFFDYYGPFEPPPLEDKHNFEV